MVTLYGIKNCDTVKKARLWLDQHGVTYHFHDFRGDGLSAELLQQFIDRSAWQYLLNRNSTSWRQLSAEQRAELDQPKAFELMLATPTLIKRPLLVTKDRFIIGFDLDHYQSLL
jgi:arsenate reductase